MGGNNVIVQCDELKMFHNICGVCFTKLMLLIRFIAKLFLVTHFCSHQPHRVSAHCSLLLLFLLDDILSLVSQDMSENSGQQLLVKARFNFQQTNEDELTFTKGDIISVTRQEDGGWWEGMLNGRTGWFPSNYVREIKGSGGCM